MEVVLDVIAFSGHDIIKNRKMPPMAKTIQNILIPTVYHYGVKSMIQPFSQTIPVDIALEKEIFKFIGEAAVAYGYRYLSKQSLNVPEILLKQAIVSSSVAIYNMI